MSRHSDLVHLTTERIAATVNGLITDALASALAGEGRFTVRLVPWGPERSAIPAEIVAAARALVDQAAIDDLSEAELSLEVRSRSRVLKCVVGDSVSERLMSVADVAVRARIRTRWVDIWKDAESVRQWVAADQAPN